MNKERSPFSPGRPVPVEYFTGRMLEIEKIGRAINQCTFGKNENIFLTGERGIGKSSLSDIMLYIAEKRDKFLCVHSYLSGAKTLEDACRIIFQNILEAIPEKNIFEKVKTVFEKYIKSLNFTIFGFGVKAEFTRDQTELSGLKLGFVNYLQMLYDRIKEEKKGIFLVLDDLNGLGEISEFGLALKSWVDSIASKRLKLPFLLMLVGVPERMSDLMSAQPSIGRIFNVVELKPMSNEECMTFFKTTFGSVGMEVDDDAMEMMSYYSGGLPVFLHEIGEAVFWNDTDNHIDKKDADIGIIKAAEEIGRKYLDIKIYKEIRSDIFKSILRKIGKLPLQESIKRKNMLSKSTEPEKKNFDNFIQRMIKLGVIKQSERIGEYEFTNVMFRVYVWLEALRTEKQK